MTERAPLTCHECDKIILDIKRNRHPRGKRSAVAS